MSDQLSDRLTALDRHCQEIAGDLREPGMALDRDPESIHRFLNLPALYTQRCALMPPDYLDSPYRIGDRTYDFTSCLERVVSAERLAYGDVGALLAAPGPSLSGAIVRALGNADQQRWYFGRLADAPTWTFFAMTEPNKGSAAAELETTLTADGEDFVIRGEKRYVGNGAHGDCGVVLCRRAPGPFGIDAVLVEADTPGFHAELLPTVGMRGARISRIVLDNVRVPREQVLGSDRLHSRRGLIGAIHTLLNFRPGQAAMALGMTSAVLAYVADHCRSLGRYDRLRLEELKDCIAVTRRVVREQATEVDAGRPNPHRIAMVKMRGARLAEEATLLAVDLLGTASLLEHPWLEKTYRDVRAFEFMEGTSDIHRIAIFQGVLKSRLFEYE